MANEYATILEQAPQPTRASPSIQELRHFCDGITEYIKPHGACELERGFLVNYGQEFRVTLIRNDNQYKLILLRAYVPLDDVPVMLDMYDVEMVKCDNTTKMKAELSNFLRRESVRNQIQEWVR